MDRMGRAQNSSFGIDAGEICNQRHTNQSNGQGFTAFGRALANI